MLKNWLYKLLNIFYSKEAYLFFSVTYVILTILSWIPSEYAFLLDSLAFFFGYLL